MAMMTRDTHDTAPTRSVEANEVRFDYRPVHLETLTNEVEPIPPKARTY